MKLGKQVVTLRIIELGEKIWKFAIDFVEVSVFIL